MINFILFLQKNLILILLVLFLMANSIVQAQVVVPFAQRTSQYTPVKKIYSIKGDFTMIGNTNLSLENYGDNLNNSATMKYIDVDVDPNTLNSSSASLNFSTENGAKPQCSHVVYAGLYWTGRAHDGVSSPNVFPVAKMGSVPQTVNQDFTVRHDEEIPFVNYSLSVSKSSVGTGWRKKYFVLYTFTANGKPTIYFRFYDDLKVEYNIGYSGYSQISSTFQINSGIMTASFEPMEIYSESGGLMLTVNELKRGSSSNQVESYYQGNSEASGNLSGSISVETGIVSKNYNKHEIFLKHADEGSYTKITAGTDDIKYPSGAHSNIYSAYAEVTDYVRSHGVGNYFVADMALREGDGGGAGYYGGWGLVVVYENSKMRWRDVTLFDGYAFVETVDGDTNNELPISGFQAVQNGDVNVKLGLIAGEGDRDIDGDYIRIKNAANSTWVSLSHDGNSSGNFFNSSISTGGNTRNPNLLNNTGLDISMFNVPNDGNVNIANSQTSTAFQYGTSQDTYFIMSLVMAVDAYVPEAEANNTVMTIGGNPVVDGSTVMPGQEIVYKIDIRNRGTEVVNDAKLVLPIPYTIDYVDNSSVVNFSPAVNTVSYNISEGATGSLVWEIGDLPIPAEGPDYILASLTYRVKVTTDCAILGNPNCNPAVAITGGSSGTGATSGNVISGFSIVQGYETSGECQGEPIITPIEIVIDAEDYVAANCSVSSIETEQEYFFCNLGPSASIDITEVSGNFPAGCRFYDSFPVVDGSTNEYTIDENFPATIGTETYYAVPPGYTSCYYTFKITVKNINSVPVVSIRDLNYCLSGFASELEAVPSVSSYRLFYYTEETGGSPQFSLVPDTDEAGTKIYYVAEGESASCLSSNRVPLTVEVHPISKPIGIFYN